MMDWYIYWLIICGIPVQAFIGWYAGKFIARAVWSFAQACSAMRWMWAIGNVHGFHHGKFGCAIRYPFTLCLIWCNFLIDGDGQINTRYGTWHAIGNWSVFPKR